MKLFWTFWGFVALAFWLAPVLFGLVDVLAWILLSHGITGADWTWWRILSAGSWTVAGIWIFGLPAILCFEEADQA